jgi:hypothetical protein
MAVADALQLSDGRTSGVVLGQSSSDLVAVFGGTPIAQKSGAAQATVASAAVTVASAAVSTLSLANCINSLVPAVSSTVALVNEIRNCLVSYGWLAGA